MGSHRTLAISPKIAKACRKGWASVGRGEDMHITLAAIKMLKLTTLPRKNWQAWPCYDPALMHAQVVSGFGVALVLSGAGKLAELQC